MRFEDIERRAAQHRRVGEGEAIRRLGRWSDVQAVRERRPSGQSLCRWRGLHPLCCRPAARPRARRLEPPQTAAEDYREVPAKEGIRQGVEERSYEEGNALIIERTVRVEK